jgi:hypothetical protein
MRTCPRGRDDRIHQDREIGSGRQIIGGVMPLVREVSLGDEPRDQMASG